MSDNEPHRKSRARRLLPAVLTLVMIAWIALIVVLIAGEAKPG